MKEEEARKELGLVTNIAAIYNTRITDLEAAQKETDERIDAYAQAVREPLQDFITGLLFMKFGRWPLDDKSKASLGQHWLDMLPELEVYYEERLREAWAAYRRSEGAK